MIPTAIGLPTSRRGVPLYLSMQTRLKQYGFVPYMPQLAVADYKERKGLK